MSVVILVVWGLATVSKGSYGRNQSGCAGVGSNSFGVKSGWGRGCWSGGRGGGSG